MSRHKCHQWQFPYKKAENQFPLFYMLNDKTVNNKLIKQQATSFKKVGCLLF
ncbi:hypothetical protein MCR_1002 [Moraxella catarrhalis BBH18]|nr:hypothetical protein MCR_1002 [Moraxella catarrhalis BBH18]